MRLRISPPCKNFQFYVRLRVSPQCKNLRFYMRLRISPRCKNFPFYMRLRISPHCNKFPCYVRLRISPQYKNPIFVGLRLSPQCLKFCGPKCRHFCRDPTCTCCNSLGSWWRSLARGDPDCTRETAAQLLLFRLCKPPFVFFKMNLYYIRYK